MFFQQADTLVGNVRGWKNGYGVGFVVVVTFVALVVSSLFFSERRCEDFQAGKIRTRGKKRERWRFQEIFFRQGFEGLVNAWGWDGKTPFPSLWGEITPKGVKDHDA